MSLYNAESKPAVEAPELAEPNASFETALFDIARGDVTSMSASLKRLLVLTMGYSTSAAQGAVAILTMDMPLARPHEFGVRVLKPAMPTMRQREQLLLRVSAYITTSAEAAISPNAAIEWSSQAIESVAALRHEAQSDVHFREHQLSALGDYISLLHGHMDRIINQMSELTEHDTETLQSLLEAVKVVDDLRVDLVDAFNGLEEDIVDEEQPAFESVETKSL